MPKANKKYDLIYVILYILIFFLSFTQISVMATDIIETSDTQTQESTVQEELLDTTKEAKLPMRKIAPIGMRRTSSGEVTEATPIEDDSEVPIKDLPILNFLKPQLNSDDPNNGDRLITSTKFTHKDGTPVVNGDYLTYSDTYELIYYWTLPNGEFHGGEKLIFSIPDEIMIDDTFSFPVKDPNPTDPNDDIVGYADILGNNKNGYRIEMTLTSYVDRHSNISGYFIMETHINQTYAKGGKTVIEFPDKDITVNLPEIEDPDPDPDPDPNDPPPGEGWGEPNAKEKKGNIVKDKDGRRVLEWEIDLGIDELLGDTFNSLDDIKSITISDKPENQKLIPHTRIKNGFGDAFMFELMWWTKGSYHYGAVERKDPNLKVSPDYRSFEYDILPSIKANTKDGREGLRMYELQYYTEPDDIMSTQDLKNTAHVSIVGKNGIEEEYTLVDTVKWTVADGGASGENGQARLVKEDKDNRRALAGAEFDLYKRRSDGSYQEENINLITNSRGEILIGGLTVGDYYFQETSPPEGYEMPGPGQDKWYFKINASDIQQQTTVTVTAYNQKLADRDFTFTKIDESSGGPIGNNPARFELEYYSSPYWYSTNRFYDTDRNGQIVLDESDFESLDPGYYRFKEIRAPYGYELPLGNDRYTTHFEVGDYTVNPDSIKKSNRKLNHKLSLQKKAEFNTSTNSPTRVDGIEFVLQSRNGGNWNRYTSEVFVTDQSGMIRIDNESNSGLIEAMVKNDASQFRFREYSVPPGRGFKDPEYPSSGSEKDGNPGNQFSAEIPIQQFRNGTDNGQNVTVGPLVLENKLIRYDMSFTKMDSVNKDRLKGAEFTMTEKGKPNTAVVSQGNNGVFDFKELIINREYEIKETKAPEGYGARSDIYVVRLDLDEKMHVARKNEKGQTVDLVEGTDFTWNNGQLKLNFAVENTAMPKMPMTGGIGMTIYGMVGAILMGTGFILYKYIEKDKKRSR